MTTQPDLFTRDRRPLDEQYRDWRATEEGQRVIGYVATRALEEARTPGVRRVEINALFADARRLMRLKCNNSWRAFLARELRAKYLALRDLIEVRERRAA